MRRIGANPNERGERVVDSRGIFVLRRETIIDGNDTKAALVRHETTEAVMGLDVADYEPAAMKVDQGWHRIASGRDRRIDADGNRAGRSRHRQIFGLPDRYILRADELHQANEDFSRRDGSGLGHLGSGNGGHLVEKTLHQWIERHRAQIPRMTECEFGQNRQTSARSVKGDLQGRIETAFDDIVEEYAHGQPEPRAIDGPFRLKG